MLSPPRERAFDVLLRCFADSIGASTATLFLSDETADVHVGASWAREGHEEALPTTRDSLLGRALAARGPLVQPAMNGSGPRHRAAAAAFSHEQRLLGAIHAGFDPPTALPYRELVWTADSYARMAALCMAPDVTLATALGSTGFDALTGCLSHAGVMEILEAEAQRSERRGHRLCCCLLDIDRFVEINAARGRLEGNRVLAAAGKNLSSSARRYDAVGRFGGNSFMIVLPETGGHARRGVAERFLASMRSAVFEATSIEVNASVGVAEWDGECSPSDLVAAAEQAMRRAKSRGGGRVDAEYAPDRGADGLAELTRALARPWVTGGDRSTTASDAGWGNGVG